MGTAWRRYREAQLLRSYRARREYYARAAEARGLRYSHAGSAHDIRARIAKRGYTVVPSSIGAVHTFAFVPRFSWHGDLLSELAELGPVTEFDYTSFGYTLNDFRDPAKRRAMNERVLPVLADAHARRPVDWVFVYANGREIEPGTIRRIREELGIPTVNLCLDDRHSWVGVRVGAQRTGQIDIAAEFDVSWTSARVACEWYMVEHARPIYLPEGFAPATHYPLQVARDIPVSFVGAAYGFRPFVIRELRKYGIDVQTFGRGWGNGEVTDINTIVNRSVINLGMGGIGYTTRVTNVKGRDFEIPGTGGGAYLTSYNSDLAQHFEIGREILCYRDIDELVEQIRFYLADPDRAAAIGQRARSRSLREHRWLHRFIEICEALGILPAQQTAESAVPVGALQWEPA